MLARLVRAGAGYVRAAAAARASSVAAPRLLLALRGTYTPPAADALVACRRHFGTGPAKGVPQPVVLREEDLDEAFVKGSGKGGQKINKVRNCVLLKHVPTGLLVRCQKTRSLDDNRRVARKLLLRKLDDHVNGALSARSAKIDRLRKKKRSQRARSKAKYGGRQEGEEGEVEELQGDDGDEEEAGDSDEEYDDEEDSERDEQRP